MALKKIKKLSRAAGKALDVKHFGDEPIVKVCDQTNLLRAYNWFNYMCDSDDALRFVLEYLENEDYSKEYVAKVKRVDKFDLRTIGWTLRLALNGSAIEEETVLKVLEKLDKLVAATVVAQPVTEPKVKRDTTGLLIGNAIATIDQNFDTLVLTGETKFTANTFLDGLNIGPAGLKKIRDHYQPLVDELYAAINSKDADLKEAYSCFKKPQLRKMQEFVLSVMGAMDEKVAEKEAAKPKTRKVRKKKVKSPELLTKKVKYLAKDETYGLTSVEPAKVIGATQAWLFNVKDRKLTMLNAATAAGFTVKGTTIVNIDEKTSVMKRVRKPEPVLKNLLEGGKVTVRKLMETINSIENKATGRLGADTLIVKVVK